MRFVPARLPLLDVMRQNLSFTRRTLRRENAFTILTILILVLGLGANVAVLSVVRRSVVVTRSPQLLREGALRLCREPSDLRAPRRPAGTAGFGNDLGQCDQLVQSRPGFGSIGLLPTVVAGRDDQHSFSCRAIGG
jgi:hypothetical protein